MVKIDFRHQRRVELIKLLYAFSFDKGGFEIDSNLQGIFDDINKHTEEINKKIIEAAPKFSIDRIAKIDLAILKLAVYELFVNVKEPQKVIINEAVELAKEFGGERSYAFVNAVLGKMLDK